MASDFQVGLYEGVNLFERVGVPRGSLKFTNTSGQLRMTAGPSSMTAFTFSTWVKITTDTNFYALWISLQGASSSYIEAGFDITGNGFEINDLSTERTIGGSATVGTWYYFAFKMGASGAVTIYTGPQGGSLTKYTTTLTNLTSPLSDYLLGGELSYEHLSGAMSETRFWNAVLSDAEMIAEFYSDTMVRTSNAGGYWKFPNPTNKLVDSSAASNTLTAPTGTGTWAFEPGPDIQPNPVGSVYENVPMSETINAVHTAGSGTAYTGNVNETVTLSEVLAAIMATVGATAETVTVSEAAAASRGTSGAPSETVTVSEATAAAYAANEAPTENVSLSEATGVVMATVGNTAETVVITEATAASRGMTEGTAETVTVSEATGAVYAAIEAPSETVTVSDAAGAAMATSGNPAETVTVSEVVIAGTAYTGSPSETVTVSEAQGVVRGAVVSSPETVAVTEATGNVMAANATAAEFVQVSIPALPALPSTDLHLVAEDWTPGGSWASRVGSFTATLTGTLQKQAAPAIERNEIFGFSASDYFVLPANAAHDFTNSLQCTWEFVIRSTGSAGGALMGWDPYPVPGGYDFAQYTAGILIGVINDAMSDYYRLNVGLISFGAGYSIVTFVLDSTNDTLTTYVNGVLDNVATGHTGTLATSTSGDVWIGNSNGNPFAGAFDGGIIEVNRHRAVLNGTQVAERFLNAVAAGSAYGRGVSETVVVSEALGNILGAVGALAETVTLSESAATLLGAVAGLSENPALAEAVSTLQGMLVALSETAAVTEAVSLGSAYTGTPSETVTIGEALGGGYTATVSPSETVALIEALGSIVAAAVALVESPAVAETLAAVQGFSAALAETVTQSEAIAAGRGFNADLSEAMALTEALASMQAALVALTNTVTLTESVSGIIPLTESISLIARLRETAYTAALAAVAYSCKAEVSMSLIEIVGTRVRLSATFTKPDGTYYNPNTLSLVVEDPDGTEHVYNNLNGLIHNVAVRPVGDFYCDVLFDVAGECKYQWRSTATGEEAITEGRVRVLASGV